MASIKSIQDILFTYQKVYGTEALLAELNAFQKGGSTETVTAAPEKKKSKKSSSASSVASSETKEKKPRGPSAWNAFIEVVAGKGKDETPEFSAWKATQVDQKGNLKMVFAKEMKAKDPESYKLFESGFKKTAPAAEAPSVPEAAAPKPEAEAPVSSASSVTSEGSTKKKAGRPKGSKNKPKDTAKVDSSDSEAEAKPKKVVKKAVKKPAAAPAPAPLPESDSEEEGEVSEMSAITIDGASYFWDEASGKVYESIDGAMGDLAGSFDGITLTPA